MSNEEILLIILTNKLLAISIFKLILNFIYPS